MNSIATADDESTAEAAAPDQRRDVQYELFHNYPSPMFSLMYNSYCWYYWYCEAQEEVAAKECVLKVTDEEMNKKDREISLLTAQNAKLTSMLEEKTRELEEAKQTIDRLNGSQKNATANEDLTTNDDTSPLLDSGKSFAPWKTLYEELLAYKETHGHCNVPQKDKSNPRLGSWVDQMRKSFKNGTLELKHDHIRKLNSLGFVWSVDKRRPPVDWTTSYNELVAYKEEYGHCNVSRVNESHKTLRHWVRRMQIAFKNGKLSDERVSKLNEIGFVWDMSHGNDKKNC